MIYDDRPIESDPTGTTKWSGRWDPESLVKGKGVIIEGTYRDRGRHVIIDSSGQKHRFVILHVEVTRAHCRQFDAAGQEIEPNFGLQHKVNTGYLNSSYRVEPIGESDALTFDHLVEMVSIPPFDTLKSKHSRCVVLWGEEKLLGDMEFDVLASVRAKTRGDSALVETISQLDSVAKKSAGNYAGGEKTGASWTAKIMDMKAGSGDGGAMPGEENEGVDEDEWGD
jgi:hypothetical protein